MSRRVASILGHGLAVAALVTTSAIHAARYDYSLTGTSRFAWSLAYLVFLVLMAYAFGLPDAIDDRSPFLTALVAAASAALGISAAQLASGSAGLPRFVLFTTAGVVVVGWTLIGRAYRYREQRESEADRVVFVGAEKDAATLRADVDCVPERRSTVVVTVTADDVHPIGRGDEPLVDVVIDANASILVIGRDVAHEPRDRGAGVDVARIRRARSLPDRFLHGVARQAARVRAPTHFADVRHQRSAREALRACRSVFSTSWPASSAGLVFLVVLPFVLVGNLVANRGPLFFRQDRVGASGRMFSMLKLRTMTRAPTRRSGRREDDPRITPFGRVLRRTHLDELPQFVNILRGELSIVGPAARAARVRRAARRDACRSIRCATSCDRA